MSTKTSITWYLARNYRGEFNGGETYDKSNKLVPYWVDDVRDARFHDTISPIKSCVTKQVKRFPDEPIPEILEWTIDISTAKVIDVAGETNKRIKRAAHAKAAQDERNRLRNLEYLEEEEKRLQARRKELMR